MKPPKILTHYAESAIKKTFYLLLMFTHENVTIKCLLNVLYPSCWHTTLASVVSAPSSDTVPQTPDKNISTRPSHKYLLPTRRMFPSLVSSPKLKIWETYLIITMQCHTNNNIHGVSIYRKIMLLLVCTAVHVYVITVYTCAVV